MVVNADDNNTLTYNPLNINSGADSNWEIEGDDPMGQMMKMDAPFEEDCGCDK